MRLFTSWPCSVQKKMSESYFVRSEYMSRIPRHVSSRVYVSHSETCKQPSVDLVHISILFPFRHRSRIVFFLFNFYYFFFSTAVHLNSLMQFFVPVAKFIFDSYDKVSL